MDQRVKDDLAKHQELVKKYLASIDARDAVINTYSYDCTIKTGAAGGGYVAVDFMKAGRRFAYFEGGLFGGFGAYYGWGTAWFNSPVEDLIGKAGGFALEVVGILFGTAHMQITGTGFIGNCSTYGLGAGGGLGTGGGEFKKGS